jgi:hypothetical protein
LLLLLWVNKLYKILEVAKPTAISLISAKKCSKIISQTGKFVFLMIFLRERRRLWPHPQPLEKAPPHTTTDGQGHGGVQGHLHLTHRGTLHCQVKHSIDLTLGASLPNGLIYRHSVLENDEIKRQIQELLQKGHIRPSSSPLWEPDRVGTEEGWDLETLY